MRGRLILLFIIGPLAELYILIKIGSHIGGFNTILLVFMTAVSGRFAGASAKFAHSAANSIKPVAGPNSGGGIDRRRADSCRRHSVPHARRAYRFIRAGFAVFHYADILQALAAAPIRPHGRGQGCPAPISPRRLLKFSIAPRPFSRGLHVPAIGRRSQIFEITICDLKERSRRTALF